MKHEIKFIFDDKSILKPILRAVHFQEKDLPFYCEISHKISNDIHLKYFKSNCDMTCNMLRLSQTLKNYIFSQKQFSLWFQLNEVTQRHICIA